MKKIRKLREGSNNLKKYKENNKQKKEKKKGENNTWITKLGRKSKESLPRSFHGWPLYTDLSFFIREHHQNQNSKGPGMSHFGSPPPPCRQRPFLASVTPLAGAHGFPPRLASRAAVGWP
jgi:hypothetical protein